MSWEITLVVASVISQVQKTLCSGQLIYDSCLNADPTSPVFLMDCGADGVIVDIQYIAGAGQCSSIVCEGESASLLRDANSCHWNRKCHLSPGSPAERIVRSSGNCHVRGLSFLRVKGYRCFFAEYESSGVIDICDHGIISRTSGIIRSHADYPWNYPNSARKCSLSLVVQRGTRLYVSALDGVDIGEDDALRVTSHSTMNRSHLNSSDGVLVVSDNRDTNVTFIFDVINFTQSGSGFALCFKFSDKEITGNVCNEVTARGVLTVSHGADDDASSFLDQMFAPAGYKPLPDKPKCNKKCQNQKRRCRRKIAGKRLRKNRTRNKGRKRGTRDKRDKKWKELCYRKFDATELVL